MNHTLDISSAKQKTILIVEDEPLMLQLLKKFFSRYGYHVLQAADGEQAIEAYRNNTQQIGAVLLDSRLPKMNGEEVFHLMKAKNSGVKVVMASGCWEPNAKTELSLAGVEHFATKPYILDDLLKIVEDILQTNDEANDEYNFA